MSDRLTAIQDYFQQLGLDVEIAALYFVLYTHGPQSISKLSRESGVERTRIYRLLDTLQNNALIEVETHYKRKILKAAPFTNLQVLFSKKEQKLAHLQQQLPKMEELLQRHLVKSSGTKIQFYQGEDGAKQILWNETRAQGEVVAILYENIQAKTAEKFFERWAARCNENSLRFRGVVSDTFLRSQSLWYATHATKGLNDWQARYINAESFAITHSTIIYDDVVAYYSWQEREIFGIEIYNQEIADAQREFFEMLWGRAKEVKDR